MKYVPLLAIVFLSLLGVAGDCLIKLASQTPAPLKSRWFYGGMLVFALTAFGWVYAFKHVKVASIGVFYSISTVLMLVFVGVVFFKEVLNATEILGCILAILSLVMLGRIG